jgi:hypothetical protein
MRRFAVVTMFLVLTAVAACGGEDTENVQPIGPTTSGPNITVPPIASNQYEGSGNATIDVEAPVPDVPFVARINNEVAGPFIVDSLDADGQAIDNLVDTIGVYAGSVPVDFNPSLAKTAKLDIQAPGAWLVTLEALSTLPTFSTDFAGNGDDVIVYNGDRGNAHFVRQGQGPVVVTVYPSLSGGLPDTLLNDKDDVETDFLIPSSGVVQVQTSGPWTFSPAG